MQQTARRNHLTAMKSVQKFWQQLLEPVIIFLHNNYKSILTNKQILFQKVDVNQLSILSGRIATAERKAGETYNQMLIAYPKNVRYIFVLTFYIF